MYTKDPMYQLYEDSVSQLVKTLVIKIDAWGVVINKRVESITGTIVPTDDRTVWKYYMNLAGMYHAIDTDMYVASHDSETTIPFTVDSLADNPVTKEAYQYGTVYYNELITQYANQISLINGIINPIDINTAINASDGKILAYDSSLVESQEFDLINSLQWIIDAHFKRWYNPLYQYTGAGYLPVFTGELYLQLKLAALILRHRNVFTNQAHSFHVKQYLVGKGLNLNDLKYLDNYQLFGLYRNIDYYLSNAGQVIIFDDLVKLLLTRLNINLYEYRIHNKVNELSRISAADTTNLLPTISFDKINVATNTRTNQVDLTTIHALLEDQAPDNATYIANNLAAIENTLRYTPASEYGTKLLEVELPASSILYTRTLNDILLAEWLSLAASDMFNVPVEVTLPGNSTPTRLSHQQAILLWIMSITILYTGVSLATLVTQQIPKIDIRRILPNQVTSLVALEQSYPVSYFDNDALTILQGCFLAKSTITSTNAFMNYCTAIQQMELQIEQCIASQGTSVKRALLRNAAKYAFTENTYQVTGYFVENSPYVGKTWAVLLGDLGLNISDYQRDDYLTVSSEVFKAATGATDDLDLLSVNTQAAVVNILKTLLSYTIMIVDQSVSSVPINTGTNQTNLYFSNSVTEGITFKNISAPVGIRLGAASTITIPEKDKFIGITSSSTSMLKMNSTSKHSSMLKQLGSIKIRHRNTVTINRIGS